MSCKICGNNFNKTDHLPHFLIGCGDIICSSCVKSLIEKSPEACPICKVATFSEPKSVLKVIDDLTESTSRDRYIQNIQKKYSINVVDKEKFLHKDNLDCFKESIILNLKHENLLESYFVFYQAKNRIFIFTENCEGDDLNKKIMEKLTNSKTFSKSEILKWTKQIVLGLDFLHKNAIIHGDIRPSKIFLTNNAKTIKIGALGQAISSLETASFDDTTAYMSPEMFRNEDYSYETDIWSFGCVLYELLTLKKYTSKTNINTNLLLGLENWHRIFKGLLESTIIEKFQRETSGDLIDFLKKYQFKLRTLSGHSKSVRCLVVLEDGNLCSGSEDRTIKIWNALEGNLIQTLSGHNNWVNCLTVLSDKRLCSGSQDYTIKIWNLEEETIIRTLEHSSSVNCLAVLKDSILCSGSSDTIKLWNPDKGVLIRNIKMHSNDVLCLSAFDNLLCSGSKDRTIKIWNAEEGQLIHTFDKHTNYINSLILLKDGILYSGSEDKTIKKWNAKEGRFIKKIGEHSFPVECLNVLEDGCVCSGSSDATIKLWNPLEENLIMTLSGHSKSVRCLTALNGYLCSGSSDNTIIIWDPIY